MNRVTELIDELFEKKNLSKEDFIFLINHRSEEAAQYLFEKAGIRRRENFGNGIYIRGIVEFSSYCRCDCFYCGLRRSNQHCERYRLSREDILQCCRSGYEYGFRTFVLQSGEDLTYSDDDICDIVRQIKQEMPDCAVTLSIGEKSFESYQKYYDAGADRYLLRHETASPELYKRLHPSGQTLENRIRCLYDLKKIGYQVGAGMMIQAPYQTAEDLAEDFVFLKQLEPDMIGVGPFIPHRDTPFRDFSAGSLELTLFVLGILRCMFPKVLLPSTTALGTIDPAGREKGVLAGGNVIMPNLSPQRVRGKYLLYNNKLTSSDDARGSVENLRNRMETIGCEVVISRGDAPGKGPH
ncbi:MAG: [FeFe] hydrogenase H-cluster radical SAM maturase HydE [Solobacterium sp.]|nr:[FeFe] hydrogenase H-cluster radical SAM maturase HydE [Solobacterium sp.]